ncbi:SAVED domain-containing protein [Bacillus cereus group sp. RP29]|uniref:Hachiman antiphage defense system protein HamA n=1 Tax=Bacillus cereus group TaxID=86661 RepID=UPI00093775E9|nr:MULTISPECIES: Hachiman antiphage defense system protein HamA [Bacillus cereus group]MEC1632550.1 SAVED domain-containing protein [Bacillus paranthracis]OUA67895.1 virulence associated protein [Bacillus thuringiensis serovar thailandensis]
MISTTQSHTKWFVDAGTTVLTSEGKNIEIFEFKYEQNDETLSSWAKHFRQHYCLDSEIDYFRKGYKFTRTEYLNRIKFPDPSRAPGPSIRAGDFSEILVADYLEFILNYWVPRTRYGTKTISNESTKGCDTLAFKIISDGEYSPEDTLAIFETKAQFSGTKANPRLQDAVDDSKKDIARKGESLNAIKQQLFLKRELEESEKIDRFQNPTDYPYKEISGAVAMFSSNLLDLSMITNTSINEHPNKDNLTLLVIHGEDMMPLVHELYRRAAHEA